MPSVFSSSRFDVPKYYISERALELSIQRRETATMFIQIVFPIFVEIFTFSHFLIICDLSLHHFVVLCSTLDHVITRAQAPSESLPSSYMCTSRKLSQDRDCNMSTYDNAG